MGRRVREKVVGGMNFALVMVGMLGGEGKGKGGCWDEFCFGDAGRGWGRGRRGG